MRVTKKVLGTMERVYAASAMTINGKINYIVATEGSGRCLQFSSEDIDRGDYTPGVIWEQPGGTMSIVPVPGREGEFIATQKFFPTFQAEESVIVHARVTESGIWKITEIMKIPYLHRFDLFMLDGKLHIIAATLCTSKKERDDWSDPGKVYVGKFCDDITQPFKLKVIHEGITKNHGFCSTDWYGEKAFLITGIEGVFLFRVPENAAGEWKIKCLMDTETSDAAVCDIDGDGELELATISPFHGDKGTIFKSIDGSWVPIHEHNFEFGHVIWGGTITGKPSFIIAGRKGNQELVLFQADDSGSIISRVIDNTGGPSNIAVVNFKEKDVILAANRQVGEIALYEITS